MRVQNPRRSWGMWMLSDPFSWVELVAGLIMPMSFSWGSFWSIVGNRAGVTKGKRGESHTVAKKKEEIELGNLKKRRESVLNLYPLCEFMRSTQRTSHYLPVHKKSVPAVTK
jgi:hypothetical protein